MKIKVAIVEKDELYLNRIVSSFNDFYANDVELFTFSDAELALNVLSGKLIDVFLIGECFVDTIVPQDIPFQAKMIAYFVETRDIETINIFSAICKYQKVDLIYKSIIDLLANNDSYCYADASSLDSKTKVFAITSAVGGVGVSTLTAGFAFNLAKSGKKVMYLSLEDFSSADLFFSDEGDTSFSDVIYAILSRKSNLAVKLKTCAKTDSLGVNFFSPCKCVLEMSELNDEGVQTLIASLIASNEYDYILIDIPLRFNRSTEYIFKICNSLLCITDGTFMTNRKTVEAFEGMKILDSKKNTHYAEKFSLIYNKYLDSCSNIINKQDFQVKGAVPMVTDKIDPRNMALKISNMAMWLNIARF
ncbi:MAG: AAA family ATPase [Hominimerdicola sp.]